MILTRGQCQAYIMRCPACVQPPARSCQSRRAGLGEKEACADPILYATNLCRGDAPPPAKTKCRIIILTHAPSDPWSEGVTEEGVSQAPRDPENAYANITFRRVSGNFGHRDLDPLSTVKHHCLGPDRDTSSNNCDVEGKIIYKGRVQESNVRDRPIM